MRGRMNGPSYMISQVEDINACTLGISGGCCDAMLCVSDKRQILPNAKDSPWQCKSAEEFKNTGRCVAA